MQWAIKDMGDPNVPAEVKRRRRSVYDAMRRFGSPVVVKHLFTDEDVYNGTAEVSPGFDDVYGQTRNKDPLSYGMGFVSVEKSADEWYNTSTGEIVVASVSPGVGWARAPKYRGFGEGFLTYIIEPDRAEDIFKLLPTGALIKTQTATAQAPWFPEIRDNDLLVDVILNEAGSEILSTQERYQAKMTNPITIRGRDRRGRRERGMSPNRFLINQQFEMTLIPNNNILYEVDLDR